MSRRTARIERIPVSDRESGPYAITTGPDGALWFTLVHAGQVARLTPGGGSGSRPHAITADPARGVCWFTEWGTGRVGSITPDGQVEEYDLPDPASEPHGLAVGPDGAVYVALEIGEIARLEP